MIFMHFYSTKLLSKPIILCYKIICPIQTRSNDTKLLEENVVGTTRVSSFSLDSESTCFKHFTTFLIFAENLRMLRNGRALST